MPKACPLRLVGEVDGAPAIFQLERGEILVGGSRTAGVRLRESGVSRRHAELAVTDGAEGWRVRVRDLGSKNGTWIEGHRVHEEALDLEQEVRFGSVRLRLEMARADAALELALDLSTLAASAEPSELEQRATVTSAATLQSGGVVGGGAADGDAAASFPELSFPETIVPGTAPAMTALYREMRHLLRGEIPVLLRGETGTGKEHLARLLHDSSLRREGPFVALNCAAIPAELLEAELFGVGRGVATGVSPRRGRFREAEGGTLLLDEIGDLPPVLQPKLLRVLQEGEVVPLGEDPVQLDVRVVASTHADLTRQVAEGGFREDLYYRLAGYVLDVPALRDRREDLAPLLAYFLGRACREAGKTVRGVTRGALRRLGKHTWPGNVRELEHAARRLVYRCASGGVIGEELLSLGLLEPWSHGEHLDPATGTDPAATVDAEISDAELSMGLGVHLERLERRLILRALRFAAGNQSAAARLLKVSRNGLAQRLERLGISPDRFRIS